MNTLFILNDAPYGSDLCDIDPPKVHVTVPSTHRSRRPVPEYMVIHRRDLDPGDVHLHDGIPIVSPAPAPVGPEPGSGNSISSEAITSSRP